MKKICNLNPLFAVAVVAILTSTGCVPGNVSGAGADLLHAPGDACTAGEVADCMGGGSQQCDPSTLTWGACTADAPCSPPPGLVQAPADSTAPCASNEWRYCNTAGGVGLAGFQLCDTAGHWLNCGACGSEVTQPVPLDAGTPAPCGGDPYIGTTCDVAVGACERSGTWVCDPATNHRYCDAMAGVSAPETCNGIDDDCDGAIDDGLWKYCYTGDWTQVGVGTWCVPGVQVCRDGVWDNPTCTGEVLPVPEDCSTALHDNGIDEDCNGSDHVCLDCGGDTSPGATCATGLGACVATGTYYCDTTDSTLHCNAVAGDGTDEVCDGIDNNCDGMTDNSPIDGSFPWVDDTCYTDATGAPLGGNPDLTGPMYRCQRGSRTCSGGAWDACAGAIGPITEICDNGIDDDCDGHIDSLDVIDCPGSAPADAGTASDSGSADAGTGSDAGTMADSGTGGSDSGPADSGSADAGTGGSDAGTPVSNAAERASCESARLTRGWVGSHSVTMDSTCLNSTLGTCATGWQVIVWDGLGCEVPSDPGTVSLTVASDNDAPGNLTRVGARCGGAGTGRAWSGPACTLPASQCVTAFSSNGTSRLADGFIMDGGSGLLPTFPSSATGGALSCTP